MDKSFVTDEEDLPEDLFADDRAHLATRRKNIENRRDKEMKSKEKMAKRNVQQPAAPSGKKITPKTAMKADRKLYQTTMDRFLKIEPRHPKSDGAMKKFVSSDFISSAVDRVVDKSADKSKSREKAMEEPMVVASSKIKQSPMHSKANQPSPNLIDLTADSQELFPQESKGGQSTKSSPQIGPNQKMQGASIDDVRSSPDDLMNVDLALEDPISLSANSPLLSAWDLVLQPTFQSRKVESPVRGSFAEETKAKLIKDAHVVPTLGDNLELVKMPDNPLRTSSPGPSIASTSHDAKKSSPRKAIPELPKLIMPRPTPEKSKKKRTTTLPNPVLSPNDSIFNESFSVLKPKEKPVGEVVVRNKDERRKLHGHECPCCEKYYDALNLTPETRAKRVNDISRHRKTYEPYKRVKTPEHFWEVDFPDTPELIKRGYLKQNF